MDNVLLRSILQSIQVQAETLRQSASEALALVPEPEPVQVIVNQGDDLQAALDRGGIIVANGTFEGAFVMRSNTWLLGANASLIGPYYAPALDIPTGTSNVRATLLSAVSAWDDSAVRVGDNVFSDPALSPDDVELSITVPTHRGKRAFYINGKNVRLIDCVARDTYDPAGRDSQGVLIHNAVGPVTIRGGLYEAGSENFLIGGAPTGIPDVQPSDILVEDVVFSRPVSWKTDGVARKVKCLFELKAGKNVTVRRCVMDGCWVNGQVGWAIMLTPRDGKLIENLLMEDITIRNAGGAICMQGIDDVAEGPVMNNLTFRRVDAVVKSGDGWGTGRFAQWANGPRDVVFENCTFDGPAQIIYAFNGNTWVNGAYVSNTDGSRGIKILNNQFACRSYGISVNGFTSGRNWQVAFPDGVIEGNTLVGPTALNHQGLIPASNVLRAA